MDAAGDAVTISLSPQVTSTLCSRSEMHHVRQAAYRTGHTGSWSNLRVLDDLARTRLDMARTIGFNSYADMGMQLSVRGRAQGPAAGCMGLCSGAEAVQGPA